MGWGEITGKTMKSDQYVADNTCCVGMIVLSIWNYFCVFFFQTDAPLGEGDPGKSCITYKRFFLRKGIIIWHCEQSYKMDVWSQVTLRNDINQKTPVVLMLRHSVMWLPSGGVSVTRNVYSRF